VTSGFPICFLTTVWFNGFIHGILIGIAAVVSHQAALFVALAIALEMILIGNTTSSSLSKNSKFSSYLIIFIIIFLSLPVLISGLAAGIFLNEINSFLFSGLLVAASSGLLYLVVEGFLREAHQEMDADTWYVSFQAFTGFIIVLIVRQWNTLL